MYAHVLYDTYSMQYMTLYANLYAIVPNAKNP